MLSGTLVSCSLIIDTVIAAVSRGCSARRIERAPIRGRYGCRSGGLPDPDDQTAYQPAE